MRLPACLPACLPASQPASLPYVRTYVRTYAKRTPVVRVARVRRPLLLAGSVWTAIRQAIQASRVERGLSPEFPLDCPASVDRVQTACAVDGTALMDSLK